VNNIGYIEYLKQASSHTPRSKVSFSTCSSMLVWSKRKGKINYNEIFAHPPTTRKEQK